MEMAELQSHGSAFLPDQLPDQPFPFPGTLASTLHPLTWSRSGSRGQPCKAPNQTLSDLMQVKKFHGSAQLGSQKKRGVGIHSFSHPT